MDNEILKTIKQSRVLNNEQIEWLIQKTEKVEQLELEINDWKESHDKVVRVLENNEKEGLEKIELIHEQAKKVNLYEKILREIRDYEAYSWRNDREFIDTRLKEVFYVSE